MIAALVETSIVAAVALLVSSFGKSFSAPLRHSVLVLALAKFAMPPGLITLPSATEWNPFAAAPRRGDPDEISILGLIYLTGVALVGLRLLVRLVQVHRMSLRAQPADDTETLELFRSVALAIGVRRSPRLLVTDEAVGPMSIGVLRPAVLIPRRLLHSLDSERLRVVFAHELVHHRRGDLWIGFLHGWLAAIWWFHPLFHLLGRRIREVREEACDDFLLARGVTSGEAYCSLLLDAASKVSTPPFAVAATSMARHPLGRRFRRIMAADLRRADRLPLKPRLALLAIALIVLPTFLLTERYGVPLHDRLLGGSSSPSPSPSRSPSPSPSPSPSG